MLGIMCTYKCVVVCTAFKWRLVCLYFMYYVEFKHFTCLLRSEQVFTLVRKIV